MRFFLPRTCSVPLLSLLFVSSGFAQLSPTGKQPSNAEQVRHAVAADQHPGPSAPARPVPLLPADFAGQPREGDIVIEPSPDAVDAAHAGVLKEDGLVEADTATYTAAGTSWKVQAMRFADTTGALSAFTFYRDPAMKDLAAGQHMVANPGTLLAQSGATLVVIHPAGLLSGPAQDATRLKPSVDVLLASLPKAGGVAAIPPMLPGLLPTPGLMTATIHYAIGPAAYNGPLPASAIDFSRDAEVVTAAYKLRSGATPTLTLVMMPTPQLAGVAQRTIAALPNAALHIRTHRTGPLVEVVSGAGVTTADADYLLSQVSYVSDVTMNQPEGYTSEVAKTARLLIGIALLTAFLGITALVVASFLGVGRVLYRRMRGLPDSSLNDESFITLKL